MVVGTEAGRQEAVPDKPFARWEILAGAILPATVTLLVLVWWIFWLKSWSGPLAGLVFYLVSTTYAFATWNRAGSRTGKAFRAGWLRFTYWLTYFGGQWLGGLALIAGAGAYATRDLALFIASALFVAQVLLYTAILAKLLADPKLDDLPRTPMLFGTITPPIVTIALCAW